MKKYKRKVLPSFKKFLWMPPRSFFIGAGTVIILSVITAPFSFKFAKRIRTDFGKFSNLRPNDLIKYGNDIINSYFSDKELPRVDLAINLNNLLIIECERRIKANDPCENYISSKDAKGKIQIDGKTFSVKIRPKGGRKLHFSNPENISLKVEVRGDKRIWGMSDFDIQDPIIRNYTYESLASEAIGKEGILVPKHKYARLYINGNFKGIKHFEQNISSDLVELQRRRYGPVYTLNQQYGTDYGSVIFKMHDKIYWKNRSQELANNGLISLNQSQENPEKLRKILYIDKWAKYFAFADALNLYHGTVPKSVRFYLNPVYGKFEPIFIDGHYTDAGDFTDFLLIDFLRQSSIIKCQWICSNKEFFKVFFGSNNNPNTDFIVSYINSLDYFSSKEFEKNLEKIINNYSSIRGEIYRGLPRGDSIFKRSLLPHIFKNEQIKIRISKLRKNITKSRTTLPLIYNNKDSFIFSNNISKIPQILITKCGSKEYDPLILIKQSPIKINLSDQKDCGINNLKISLNKGNNFFNLKDIPLIKYQSDKQFNDIGKKVIYKKLIKKQMSQRMLLKGSVLDINESKRFNNLFINIEGDVKFKINNGSTIHFENVELIGKKGSSLTFIGQGEFDSVIFENSDIQVDSLYGNNLGSPKNNLKSLYGGINILNSKFTANKVEVNNSSSEDGINFVDSYINTKFMKFSDIRSDAIDSDFSEFKFSMVDCKRIGNDCLDISFSNGSVKNFYSTKVLDKAISAGEKSNLKILEAKINSSEIGIVAKDSSSIYLDKFFLNQVKIPIALYVKKSEFGYPLLKINEPLSREYIMNSFISFESIFTNGNKIVEGKVSSKKVNKLLYGNVYGVKTTR